jgi:hypothetical protein
MAQCDSLNINRHMSYSEDLAPSDFYLFGDVKQLFREVIREWGNCHQWSRPLLDRWNELMTIINEHNCFFTYDDSVKITCYKSLGTSDLRVLKNWKWPEFTLQQFHFIDSVCQCRESFSREQLRIWMNISRLHSRPGFHFRWFWQLGLDRSQNEESQHFSDPGSSDDTSCSVLKCEVHLGDCLGTEC